MQQTILLFPLDNWHQGFCHRPRRKDQKNCDYRKSVIFRRFLVRAPFMPQLHPHPLMHRTPAAPVDLSEQFWRSGRHANSLAPHASHDIGPQYIVSGWLNILYCKLDFCLLNSHCCCFSTGQRTRDHFVRDATGPFKILLDARFLISRVNQSNGGFRMSRYEAFKNTRLSCSMHPFQTWKSYNLIATLPTQSTLLVLLPFKTKTLITSTVTLITSTVLLGRFSLSCNALNVLWTYVIILIWSFVLTLSSF